MPEYTGDLHNWYIHTHRTSGTVYATGHVHNDVRHRFEDGQFIRTSLILAAEMPEEGDKYVRTLNSVYRLVGKPADVPV